MYVFFLLMNNKLINYTTSLVDPLNEVLIHTIGVSTALISFTLFSCLFYYILRKINQFKIKNKELFNIFENNDVGLSILNKKSLNKGKEIFKELSKEEKQFLLDKEKYDYLIINPKKMKETIFDYARNNKLSKEEQKDLNEIVRSYNLNLDQEKLDLLMFKNKKENCIISNNMAVKKI